MSNGSVSGVRSYEKADDAVMDDDNVLRVVRGITGGVLESELIPSIAVNAGEAVCCGEKGDIAVDDDTAAPMVGNGGASGELLLVDGN